jgi:hypothetical protein
LRNILNTFANDVFITPFGAYMHMYSLNN